MFPRNQCCKRPISVLQRSRVGGDLVLVFGQLHLVRGEGPAAVRITVHFDDGALEAEVIGHLQAERGLIDYWDSFEFHKIGVLIIQIMDCHDLVLKHMLNGDLGIHHFKKKHIWLAPIILKAIV